MGSGNNSSILLQEFVKKIENEFGAKNLSYFELNLETWRQLWRVLEMSDIVLIIVDIRFPVSIISNYLEINIINIFVFININIFC